MERAMNKVLLLVHGEDDGGNWGAEILQGAGQFQSVGSRHVDVHHGHLGFKVLI
jgi:hypothetical protein